MTFVEPPPGGQPRFGLLEAASVASPDDVHALMGVDYTPVCGTAHLTVGACQPPAQAEVPLANVSVSVANPETATLSAASEGEQGIYTTDWGDGSPVSTSVNLQTVPPHQYPDTEVDSHYQITVTGPAGYQATVDITVVDDQSSGPFLGAAHDHFHQTDITKTVDDGVPFAEGVPFAVYHLFQCRPVGVDVPARARASFEQAEPIAVEEWFGAYLTDHPDAVDMTPSSGAISPLDGLAALEAYAGATYGGAPVFHGDRGLAALLLAGNGLVVNGGRLETRLGSRFAAGGGYASTLMDPDGITATSAEECWLYATGPVGFWRGNILDSSTGIDLTSQTIVSSQVNPRSGTAGMNVATTLLERPYVGATSCLVAAVRVTRTLCCEAVGGVQ